MGGTSFLHLVRGRVADSRASSAVLSRVVKMFAIATATAALLALSATAEAATSKNDYSGREKYKHEYHGSYKPYYKHGAYESEHIRGDSGYEDYSREDSYSRAMADREYREPRHD